MNCLLCPSPRDAPEEGSGHPPEPGWSVCWRAREKLAAALREIPLLVDELSGLGYVERDTRPERCSTPACFVRDKRVDVIATVRQERPKQPVVGVRLCADCAVRLRLDGRIVEHIAIPARPADPASHALTAGPVNGRSGAPRVAGTGERSLPIRVDPTDLLLPARPASLAVAVTGAYPHDQIGHLAVATELEFWAREWAAERRESCPYPTVPVLASWLLDRLDWACQHHPALDEFATKLSDLRSALQGAAGHRPAPPVAMDRPCPHCGLLALVLEPDTNYIVCSACQRVLTEQEYRDHLEAVIKTNWHTPDVTPPIGNVLWLREDVLPVGVTLGYWDGVVFRQIGRPPISNWLEHVSYWAEIGYPADPGPRKEEAA